MNAKKSTGLGYHANICAKDCKLVAPHKTQSAWLYSEECFHGTIPALATGYRN